MSFKRLIFQTALLCLTTVVNCAQKFDDRFSLSHPLSNSTFKHWKTTGNAVLLKNKVILSPELPGSTGMLYAKNTLNLHEFNIELDVSIHNSKRSTFPRGDFRLYMLRDNPMKSSSEYAYGLNNQFDGFQLHIQEGAIRNKNQDKKSAPPRLHFIKGYLRDEEFNLVNAMEKSMCELNFEDQTIFVHVREKTLDVGFNDPATGRENTKPCFRIPLPEDFFSVDHDTYLFISGNSGQQFANEHVIHAIRFIDVKHLHDSEEINTKDDLKPFTGKAHDVIRKGAITKHDQFTVESYNQQQVKHSKLYSKLVADFIANSEQMIMHLHKLPHHDIISNMTVQAQGMAGRFALLNQQFTTYHSDIKKYKDYLQGILKSREDTRSFSCSSDDSACKQQKIIMSNMDDLLNNIKKYDKLIDGHFLIDEIKTITKYIKETDQDLKAKDDSILTMYGKKNARDESMTKSEFKNLFSQQIRKTMSKNVKLHEKQVKVNVLSGKTKGEGDSPMVDMIMYLSIVLVGGFAFFAFKKLQDQKSTLIM